MQSNYSNHMRQSARFLIFCDFLLVLNLLIVFYNVSSPIAGLSFALGLELVVIIISHMLVFLSMGLYQTKLRHNSWEICGRIGIASVLSYLFLSFIFLFLHSAILYGNQLFQFILIAFSGSAIIRVTLYKFNVLGFVKRNILVLGAGTRAEIIVERMRRKVDQQNFNLVGFIAMPDDDSKLIPAEQIIELEGRLSAFVRKHHIHEIVVANDERRGNLPIDDLFYCRIRGVEILEILDFIEKETGQIAVNLMYPSWVIYSNGFLSKNELRSTFDWVFNCFLASLIFLLTWPCMLLTIIAIKFEEGMNAPCFYYQDRVGCNGKIFRIVKFRSMRLDAEKFGAQWACEDDPRVTKVGKFIRKYRIDELPQLYNVIKGDMGFVGPRPERPEFVNELNNKIPYYNERHCVKSGLTGWAQLKYPYGATENDAVEKLKYDLYYIKHRSFLLDLMILVQTAEIVLWGKGR